MDLTVVLPTIDEAESLRRLLPALNAALGRLGVSYELLVVDGGSRDATKAVAAENGARVLTQSAPGFGGAYLAAIPEARGAYVLTMDADGSHDAEDVPRLWESRAAADVVIGSRFVPGGAAEMPAYRYFASRVLNLMTRCFGLPARDASSGFRLYRGDVLKGLPIETRDFSVQQEVLARILARGGRCVEVPFHYRPRVGGRSKAGFIAFAGSYLRMFNLLRKLK